MAEQSDVKVFISWSGNLAKLVALALREWLPLLFDRVAPWASDSDIAAGQRGLAQIEAELADTRFGIVVVTEENQHAPWLSFEAGALSRTIDGDTEHRVVPLLVDLASPADLTGPLTQFQAKTAQQEGVRGVIRSLATVAAVDVAVADQRFDVYWPKLAEQIKQAKARTSDGTPTKSERRDKADVLDEILLHVRSLRSDLPSSSQQRTPPTVRQRLAQDFQRSATKLAQAHEMDVHDIRRLIKGGYDVTLSPQGAYSEEAEEAVKTAFREEFGGKFQKVQVEVIPF